MAPAPRIAALDTIRGVAVMGILLMNIVAFAMPEAAYLNPAGYGSFYRADFATWGIDFILVDGKMRGLFSFLFGASLLLVVERAEARGESGARVHFARMASLFVFGIAHLLLLWWGDILHHYALVGGLAFAFRRRDVAQLVAIAGLLIAAQTLLLGGEAPYIADVDAAAHAPHPTSVTLADYRDLAASFGRPDRAAIAADLATHRGSYARIFADRLPDALTTPWRLFQFTGLETLAYMLLGMAGLKSGMLTGAWPRARYRRWAALGMGIGALGYAALAWAAWSSGFGMATVALTAVTLSTPLRPVMIIGWACLIVWLAQPGGVLTARIAAAGRMAFSNYIASTLICTTLFYGYGFGLYGWIDRAGLVVVVLAIWAAMLGWSAPWLARLRYGPLEWLWRTLARGRLQPMRVVAQP